MAGELKIAKLTYPTNLALEGDALAKSAQQDLGSGEDISPSDSSTSCISSLADAKYSIKEGDADEESSAVLGLYYPTSSCHGYYYSGYDGSYGGWDDQGYFIGGEEGGVPYSGIQSEDGSMGYYMPGYNPYASGALVGVDGQYGVQQPYYSGTIYSEPYTSSGFLSSAVQYESDAVPPYSWDLKTHIGDVPNGAAGVTHPKINVSALNANAALNSKGSMPMRTSLATSSEVSVPPPDPRVHTSTPSNNNSSSVLGKYPTKPLNKVSQKSTVFSKGNNLVGNFSSFSGKEKVGYIPQNGSTSLRHGRGWAGNEKYKMGEKFNRQVDVLYDQNRGPRANKVQGPWSSDEKQLGPLIRRDHYNLKDFQTEYDHAVFFVIKSSSEDDVHKSIKYNVWASTQMGNTKLDAAFHDAEVRSDEKGSSCPVFLFFSVNLGGQFIGLSEMVGQVDFKKNMDFWQLDKWNGFFPVKWHIIKDIPSRLFHHILLKNNDNKPVTNSRDTQEINFSQGTEMLNIFKSYQAKTSILDDFGFYEDREKTLHEKRNRPMPLNSQNNNSWSQFEEGSRKMEETAAAKEKKSCETSLIALSLNGKMQP